MSAQSLQVYGGIILLIGCDSILPIPALSALLDHLPVSFDAM